MISGNLRTIYQKTLPDVTDEEILLAETAASMVMPLSFHPDFLNMKLPSAYPVNNTEFIWEVNKPII